MNDKEKIAALRLSSANSALVIIDVQDRLVRAMDPAGYDLFLSSLQTLVGTAGMFDIPVFYSEQYPQGLGKTVPELASTLAEAGAESVEKESFSCCGVGSFSQAVKASGRSHIVLTGLETHVCVFQTGVDLIDEGYHLHVVEDGVISRYPENKDIGMRLLERAGALLTCTETVLFQWLECSTAPQFKPVSQMIKDRDKHRASGSGKK